MLRASWIVVFASCAALSWGQVFRHGWRDEIATQRNPENLNAVAVDGSGNFIVAGTTVTSPGQGSDVLVRKYDPLGAKLWEAKFDTADGKLTDEVQGIIIDPSGDVFVSITTPKNGFGNMGLARLKASDGSIVFKKILDTGGDRATPFGCAYDPASGGIVQAGGYGRNAREEIVVVKWKPDGSVAWTQRWKSPVKGDAQARAVAVAPNGDVTAVGYAPVDGRGLDSVALRYSATGSLLWASTTSGSATPANDIAVCVALDPSGDAYMGGDEYIRGSTSCAYVARLAASDGKVVWKTPLLEPRGTEGRVLALAQHNGGVTAAIRMNPTSADGFDLGVVRYAPSGSETWRTMVTGGAGFVEETTSLAIDRYGYAYIAGGSTDSGKVQKFLVGCVDPLGKLMWAHRDAASSIVGLPSALAVANDSGHVALAGSVNRGVDDDLSVTTLFQAPRAKTDSYSTFVGEKLQVGAASGVLNNDVFTRYATLKVLKKPAVGTLELAADGSFVFSPPADFVGDATFTYELSREGLSSSEAAVTIHVVKKPKPPRY